MKNLITGIFLLVLLVMARPFQGQGLTIEGVIVDSTLNSLTGATVILLQKSDSLLLSFSISDRNGHFMIRKAKPGEYILQVAFLGFRDFSKSISVSKEKGGDLGYIIMLPQSSDLGEVLIKAEHIPMRIKNDTIEYNAAAFNVQAHDVVEDLLKKLPGVEVHPDGSIKAQGEDVKQVLVDGKEFFGNDPTIATKNLPANAIDKVQVFDRKSDMAEFSGVDDGERQKTINLSLKDGKKKGYFGKASAGAGTEERFEARASINRFGQGSQVSALGMSHNNNSGGFSFRDYSKFMGGIQGAFSRGGLEVEFDPSMNSLAPGSSSQSGLTTVGAGGINFNLFAGKPKWSSSYLFNQVRNITDKKVYQENLLAGEKYINEEQTATLNNAGNHRLNSNLRYQIDSIRRISFRGNFTLGQGSSEIKSESQVFGPDMQLQNTGTRSSRSDGRDFSLDGSLTFMRRYQKPGRTFSVNLDLGGGMSDSDGRLKALSNFFDEDQSLLSADSLDQIQYLKSNKLDFGSKISYTEPLGKLLILELYLKHQAFSSKQSREVFDFSISDEEIFNPALSTNYERDYQFDVSGFNLHFARSDLRITSGLRVQNSRLNGLLGNDLKVRKNFTRALPSLFLNYEFTNSTNLDVFYVANVREPSLAQLSPQVDNTDPLNTIMGNPDLVPEYVHQMNIRYFHYNQFNFTNFFAYFSSSYTRNSIVNSKTVDSLYRQTIIPINAPNAYHFSGDFSFGTPIKFIKSKLKLGHYFSYRRGSTIVNNVEERTGSFTNELDIGFENRNKKHLDLRIGTRWSIYRTTYSINETLNQKFSSQSVYANYKLVFAKKWTWLSEFDYTFYTGSAFSERRGIPLWSTAISRNVLKNDKGQIRLSVFDILNKNMGIDRSSALNYIREERTNELGRYFMLTFSYSLSGFGNKKDGSIEFIEEGRR